MIPAQPTPFQSASLYVGDLHPEITEGFLFEMFNRVGPVASIRVCRDTVTRRSLGYAYVNFHNIQDAERALDTMNFTDIKSRPCRIMWSQRDPSIRKSGVGNVFVKNLADSVDNKSLFDFFSVFGNILSCKVATDEAGVSKGYGYVHYETAEAAQEAIQKINGHMLEDKEIYVGTFLRRQDRASTNEWTNLYAKNFPKDWTEERLTEVFSPFGTVTCLKIKLDKDGNSMGFGFIDFADHESAKKAIDELNDKTFEGDENADPKVEPFTMYVNRAQKKVERERELKAKLDAAKSEQITKFQGMNLYVKNLDESITDESFLELFTPFGTVTSARIMREPSGVSKGFAFVCYSSAEEATRAITEMNGKMIGAKPLFVAMYQRKELRQQHLAATYGPRGSGNGPANNNGPRYAMQGAPMGYPVNMYPGGPMPPRQPFPMMNNMMPRGPVNMAPRGYPMPNYNMGMPVNQQQRGGRANNQIPSPVNQNRRGVQGQNQPRGQPNARGAQGQQQARGQQQNVKYTNQVRNAPQGQAQAAATTAQPMPMNSSDLTLSLASADPQTQKNMIGEHLYPLIMTHEPQLAGKITGMLLEMENSELLHLIESPEALTAKISEALSVLQAHSN
mmetsp:Transcript_19997/g.33705  ORF Transcript_19997/g.33705 Transcript_19997/m.33705 type:complete len:619 (-) Transcript_19997:244-2100(-)|eukprot:CAMPEP_0114427120 /NCGR_PEP_ID=MMETSP0103-20121206/8170_1 /TAXON_ID=37642 ORGANISM="Paraphysomonas imperforata, Strain PA2" /NCGR_SAMPLE_ID=MMETSP0103 /ASSEMBLY_ACC=CAM_ASM_000201 /LENGTH=618 /DNA_ID=CAMNT_0001596143 /DNA_START=79 /DNA_END=1935 /DNA_ORIENTATION=+